MKFKIPKYGKYTNYFLSALLFLGEDNGICLMKKNISD